MTKAVVGEWIIGQVDLLAMSKAMHVMYRGKLQTAQVCNLIGPRVGLNERFYFVFTF